MSDTQPEDEDAPLDADSRRAAQTATALLMAHLVDRDLAAVERLTDDLDAHEVQEVLAAVLVSVDHVFVKDRALREAAISEAMAVFTPNDLSDL